MKWHGRFRHIGLATLLSWHPLVAQQGAVLVVRVRDSSAVVTGAVVRLRGADTTLRTDALGEARLRSVPQGVHILETRLLGFRPDNREVHVSDASTTVDVLLHRLPQRLDAVKVVERAEGFDTDLTDMLDRWLSGQYRRSSFISRAELEERNPLLLSDALRRTPGVRLRRGRDGRMRAVSSRVPVRVGGGVCRSMNVYLDGIKIRDLDTDGVSLDQFAIGDIAGIEIYQSNATAPIQYNVIGDDCGVLLLWTKRR